MLQRLVVCAALACALLATRGLAQAPSQCVHTLRIETNREDLYIMPGVTNCVSCAVEGNVAWQITVNGILVSASSSSIASTENNYLIIPSPESYVLPGQPGRRDIVCIGGSSLEARLASPILIQPTFNDATINEGEMLSITCITGNIREITNFRVLDPRGMQVPVSVVGEYTLMNALRNASGVYTCIVTNTMTNATINATSTVVIQFAPEVTALNDTANPHAIIVGEELRFRCSYVGVPVPTVVWLQDDAMLANGVGGVVITGGAPGDNEITLVISAVEPTNRGTYTCRANNTLGMDEEQYSVIVQVPADPVTNLRAFDVGERSVSLSWMTGADGFTPITAIEITITPERGASPTPNPMIIDPSMTSTMVSDLLPFRRYEFSVAVRNAAGLSTSVSINADTLSLQLDAPTNIVLFALSSTSLNFTWDPPDFDSDTTDDPNFYLIRFSRINGEDLMYSNVSASESRNVSFTNLAKGTEYIARIVAVNDVGNGTLSNFVQRQTLVDPPTMPQNLEVRGVGATALRLNWTAPADNGGRPIFNYRITIDGLDYNQTVSADTTMRLIRDNGLTENTTYTVRVNASNEAQGFGAAATAMGTTQSILEPQTIFNEPVSTIEQSTNNSAVLTWENPGGDITIYIVEYVLARDPMGFASNEVVTVVVNGTETSVEVGGNLLPGATYNFRVAVNNSRGMSAFSIQGRFETREPDPAIITFNHMEPVREGLSIQLNCSATLRGAITYSWTKDNAPLPSDTRFNENPTQGYLRITMVTVESEGMYVCTARNAENTMTSSAPYTLQVQQVQPTEPSGGIDQSVIIIVASVGGAALLIFVIVVIIAIGCLCSMRSRKSRSSYAMKPMKSKDRPNANWIETSTQFVPVTGNQAANPTDGDRLAFDYSVDLQTHSSFNTLEKQKVHSTANGSDQQQQQPPPPSYTDNTTDV